MAKTATVACVPLRNCLCNLPLSLHGPLVQRGVPPQSIAVLLSYRSTTPGHPPTSHSVVLGWSGLPAQLAPVSTQLSRGAQPPQDRIEIDPQFAAMLGGIHEGTQVSIELLRDLPSATTVNVTPLSADDWEILETNAEFVEMFLLNQVRAVKQGMVVGCWVNGNTLVRFVVDSTVPAISNPLLLNSSTELIVAPKSRHAPPSASQKPTDLSSLPSSVPASSSKDWHATSRRLLRLLPLAAAPRELVTADSNEKPKEEEALFVDLELARKVRRAFPLGRITLSHFPRPSSASGGGKGGVGGDGDDGGTASTPTAATTSATKDESPSRPLADVRVYGSSSIPSGHVWIGSQLRKELAVDGGSSFELMRILAPLSSGARKARATAAAKDKEGGAGGKENQPPSVAGSTTTSPKISSSRPLQPRPIAASTSIAATPSPSPPRLAGIDKPLSLLSNHIITSLAARTLSLASASAGGGGGGGGGRAESAPGVLVTGSSGAGKTSLVKEVARRMEDDQRVLTHTIYVDCSKFTSEGGQRLPALKAKIKDWFDEAVWHAPSLVVLDNLDRMVGAEVEHADSFPALHLSHTFLSLALPALAAAPILLIATAQGSTNLHPLLTTTHLLGETVPLRGPDKAGRRDILNALVAVKTSSATSSSSSLPITADASSANSTTSTLTASPTLNYASLAAITEGYQPADLRDLVDRAVHQAAIRTMRASEASLTLSLPDFHSAQTGFVPLSLRDVKLQKSDVQWADIGGLHEARKTLRETLEWPTKYGAIFAGCPLRLRSGLLLYGYPGCGKTLLASAVAKECGLNFISVKGPEILNKYIGASEKSVRDLFDRAQAAKPCILFFDEFDSIAPKRGHDSTGVTDRVVNQMLTQMDGAEGLDGVYVLAATSRPDLIDPALLRPGRLDKSILCDMPSHSDRLEIMRSSARKIHLSPSVDLTSFASSTAGYSGADLQALIYNAHLDAIHEQLTAAEGAKGEEERKKGGEEEEVRYVEIGGREGGKVLSRAEQASVNKRLELIMATMKEQQQKSSRAKKQVAENASPASRAPTSVEEKHLHKSLESTRPSVPAEELARLRRIYNEFVSGRSANGLPSGEASDEVGGRASLM